MRCYLSHVGTSNHARYIARMFCTCLIGPFRDDAMRLLIAAMLVTIIGSTLTNMYQTKHLKSEYFQLGLSRAATDIATCQPNDNSKEIFPAYFQACKTLCNTLYKEKPICVSSINGGSVTCVCEQHGL